ncbi:hypothetical protein KR51_00029570 [Rubidibacter lacunae KORDI 51-2]|uniref:Cyanobacterial aminoacyl-tRNA synthetase CAAD domain-containing protein n=1 Tax=Rubidibacter lacunae KORDI 51-2 TaxID=582515 RepID=U5DGJ9_9CHRO|nr:CAAD domain-containing protein [Rubidibacter lacunae]ERN40417.1 hypothetical protein KR51_00029570 [Rubidibacter lacunae KORDI 51-2]
MVDPNVQAAAQEFEEQKPAFANADVGGMLTSPSASAPSTDQPWKVYAETTKDILGNLRGYVVEFFVEFREPLVTLLLILLAAVAVVMTRALLGALNSFPLLSPLFELIGFGYSVWFGFRYLWKQDTRQELWANLGKLVDETFGSSAAS